MDSVKYKYELFKHEINQVQDVCTIPEEGRLAFVEDCYQQCVQCWEQVKRLLKGERFDNIEAEILFFKTVKPTFTSEINYYALLYHAELFKPPAGEKLVAFFEREHQRHRHFIDRNLAFYTYYKSGHTSKDGLYFSRTSKQTILSEGGSPPDADEVSSTHDHLLGDLLSLEKYELYATKQLIAAGGYLHSTEDSCQNTQDDINIA